MALHHVHLLLRLAKRGVGGVGGHLERSHRGGVGAGKRGETLARLRLARLGDFEPFVSFAPAFGGVRLFGGGEFLLGVFDLERGSLGVGVRLRGGGDGVGEPRLQRLVPAPLAPVPDCTP